MIQTQDSHKMPGGSESPMFQTDTAAEKIDPGVGRPRVHSSTNADPSEVQIHTLATSKMLPSCPTALEAGGY